MVIMKCHDFHENVFLFRQMAPAAPQRAAPPPAPMQRAAPPAPVAAPPSAVAAPAAASPGGGKQN